MLLAVFFFLENRFIFIFVIFIFFNFVNGFCKFFSKVSVILDLYIKLLSCFICLFLVNKIFLMILNLNI